MRYIFSIGLLLVSLVCFAEDVKDVPEKTFFETYPLRIADSDGIVEVVKAVVGEKGRVIYYKRGNELIVSTSKKEHAEIAVLLEKIHANTIDTHKYPNIRIDVDFIENIKTKHHGVNSGFDDGVVVSRKGKTKVKFKPSVRGQSLGGMSNVRQTIVVRSGRSARIKIGEEVPYYDWLMEFGVNGGVIEQVFEMREVGSSLVVEATLIGDGPLIDVKLVPELSGLVNGQVNRIQYRKLATEVTIRNGSTMTIGGLSKNENFYKHFLAGAERGGLSSGLNVKLTASVVSSR
ncbi:MAG: hypothetical protein KAH23_06520 [Kiritimatiellae bacterium]|nr:hypothetical protein [Kiritimatiellia bacterium]